MENTSPTSIKKFQALVRKFHKEHERSMPWRNPNANGAYDPYKIMVSELMLQQTQVARVIPKYEAFIRLFPSVERLAEAELSDVLKAWSGLGYNRRARFLWQAAQEIITRHNGRVPLSPEELVKLPGIGSNTAAAIIVYSVDEPVIFLETNIRTVYIHHFFNDQADVSDKQLIELVQQTLPKADFRRWYYALMDYGSYLKSTVGNKSRQAKVYTKQSAFSGSLRQLRGQVLRTLAIKPLSLTNLKRNIKDDRLEAVCRQLEKDGLIHRDTTDYILG